MKFTDKYFEAVDLIDLAYRGKLDAPHHLDQDGVQAFMTEDRVLVIPGTEGLRDWADNVNVGWGATKPWHNGFFRQALIIYNWLKEYGLDPAWGTGHSLGGASGQIVFYSLKKPAIFFGAPKPLAPNYRAKADQTQIILRTDDLIGKVPRKFRHVGKVIRLKPKKHHWGEDHRIDKYRFIMKEANKG